MSGEQSLFDDDDIAVTVNYKDPDEQTAETVERDDGMTVHKGTMSITASVTRAVIKPTTSGFRVEFPDANVMGCDDLKFSASGDHAERFVEMLSEASDTEVESPFDKEN